MFITHYEVSDNTDVGLWVSMSSCICGTSGEVGSVESVADADVIAVGSLEVVGEVVPIRVFIWASTNGASLLTGGSRVGLKAFGC